MMYRQDVVLAWLSKATDDPKEPWEFTHAWLLHNGMHDMQFNESDVRKFTEMADRYGYFDK